MICDGEMYEIPYRIIHEIGDDAVSSRRGYREFRKCEICNDGQGMEIVYACGVRYRVSLESFLQFRFIAHYKKVKGRWRDIYDPQKAAEYVVFSGDLRVKAIHRIRSVYGDNSYFSTVATIFSNGLMLCQGFIRYLELFEPSYVHYGGETKEIRDYIRGVYDQHDIVVERILRKKHITKNNFGAFERVICVGEGAAVTFVVRSLDRYTVSVPEVLAWQNALQGQYSRDKATIEMKVAAGVTAGNRITAVRYGPQRKNVKLFFSNGTASDINWKTVLMHCDDRYEKYTGPILQGTLMGT